MTEAIKKQLNYVPGDDGIFWMTVEDFSSNYDQVYATKTKYTNLYSSKRVNIDKSQAFFIKVNV